MMTQHTHPVVFGRRVDGCPRCAELSAGAAARRGWGWQAKADGARRLAAIRAHVHGPDCGPCCVRFDP